MRPLLLPLASVAFSFAALSFAPLHAATTVADYLFQNVLTSDVGTIGALEPLGTSTFQPATVDGQTRQVLAIPIVDGGNGVRAQTAGFVNPANYSIALLAAYDFQFGNPVATKILDFKNRSADAGLYINATTGQVSFLDSDILAVPPIGGTAVVTGVFTQIVLTRASSGLTSVYQDGTLAFSFMDSLGDAILGDGVMPGSEYLSVFADDVVNPVPVQEATTGEIARLLLFDGDLTPEEVTALDLIPEPSVTVICGAISLILLSKRCRKTA